MRAQIVTIEYGKDDRGAEKANERSRLPIRLPDRLIGAPDLSISTIVHRKNESGKWVMEEKLTRQEQRRAIEGLCLNPKDNQVCFDAGSNRWSRPSRKGIPQVTKIIQPGKWATIEINHRFVYTRRTIYRMMVYSISNEPDDGPVFVGDPIWNLDLKADLW